MKIVMLNTSDRQGGAAVAASRLKDALEKNGMHINLIVRDKTTPDRNTISINKNGYQKQKNKFRFLWERFVIFIHNGFSRQNLFSVSIADTGIDFSKMPEVLEADIIHLHWVNHGMLSLKGLKKLLELGKPVVWTLHDMWPVTGICHHAWECERFKDHCGQCPFLKSHKEKDLSYRIFQQKKQAYKTTNLTLVPVSRWLQSKCLASPLSRSLPIRSIPNPIDTDFFIPGDKAAGRKKWDIPKGKKVLLMGAARLNDPVKGFSYLKEALSLLNPEEQKNILLILFGTIKHDDTLLENFPVEVRWLGVISDKTEIRSLYHTADFFMIPSLEDNLPNTVMESLACGTPVIGFHTGGIPEMVDHLKNGYLAPRGESDSLAEGISWALQHSHPDVLSENAREKIVSHYSISHISELYLKLYSSLGQTAPKKV